MQNPLSIAALNISAPLTSLEGLEQFEAEFWAEEHQVELFSTERNISSRCSISATKLVVLNSSLIRYFKILEAGRNQLDGVFSEEELIALLNSSPRPIIPEDTIFNLASAYVDDLGGELQENTFELELAKKLSKLSALQALVLADTMERFYRPVNHFQTMGISFETIGFKLKP